MRTGQDELPLDAIRVHHFLNVRKERREALDFIYHHVRASVHQESAGIGLCRRQNILRLQIAVLMRGELRLGKRRLPALPRTHYGNNRVAFRHLVHIASNLSLNHIA